MATASKVQLSLDYCGQFHVPNISQDSADAASEVLQENHDNYHIFFNQSGFHNHIAHHIPTLFALGASPHAIQKHYANNKAYQRPPQPVDRDLIQNFHHHATFSKYLGQERYYHDYLIFFQNEIDRKGHEEVLNEYMLKGDERADDILVRMYAGGPLFYRIASSNLLKLRLLRFLASHNPSWFRHRIQSAGYHRRSSCA
ncbi:MAG: hypothetical protein Q9224_001549, partial [Gallowayella concinna]